MTVTPALFPTLNHQPKDTHNKSHNHPQILLLLYINFPFVMYYVSINIVTNKLNNTIVRPESVTSPAPSMADIQYVHTVSETGRLLPSASRWNSIELDYNLFPHNSSSGSDSLPSQFSKSIDFNLVVREKKALKRCVAISLSLLLLLVSLIILFQFLPHKHKQTASSKDLTLALNKALLFFDAQKSGYFVNASLVKFRGNSGLNDGNTATTKTDLVGGFYDSGSNIKFSFSTAYTITLLSWSVIEYHQKYEEIGELEHVMNIVKWGSDYLLKVFVSPSNSTSDQATLFSQVGGGNSTDTDENDINCWQRPEDMTYPRPVFACTTKASDLAGEIVAALSASSLVLKQDRDYSRQLIGKAEELFKLARNVDPKQQGTYTMIDGCGRQAREFYNSSSYEDELVWGGTWLFFATGNKDYLQFATEKFNSAEQEEELSLAKGVFDWNNKLPATSVLLTRLRFFLDVGYPYENALKTSSNRTDTLMCSYLSDLHFKKTKGGLILLKPDHGTPLQYTATASFLSKLYKDYLQLLRKSGSSCDTSSFSIDNLDKFSMSQANYILGNNPMKMSYIVGYGSHYPKQVHHRAASIPWDGQQHTCVEGERWLHSNEANPNDLLGAMVAGPNQDDNFLDQRGNPGFTEPTIAGNAGLVAALIALHDPPHRSSNLGLDQMGMFENIHLIP